MDTQQLSAAKVGDAVDLKPQNSGTVVLKPDTKVLCINRGRDVVLDTFDSDHYVIPPGYFFTQLGAAKHFQARAVVPGSRNPETKFQASFIAIIGVIQPKRDGWDVLVPVDDAVQWEAFTDEECRDYGHAVEALDRSSMIDPIDREVTIEPTRGVRNQQVEASRLKGGTGVARGKTAISGPGKEFLKPGNTRTNEAMQEIAADRARVAAGVED